MSWVITRHLTKSGGNNIYFRIGQFNKRSSYCYTVSRINSSNVVQSSRYKYYQQKLTSTRKLNILHNDYSMQYKDVSTFMGKTYAREIINKITASVSRPSLYIKFYKRTRKNPEVSYKQHFIIECLRVISKSTRYNSMNRALKNKTGHSLLAYINKMHFK